MYFYELHEGDASLFHDLLLASEDEMDPDEFFRTVQEIRERIQESHGHDTLIEAIAEELERDYGFIYISDDRLAAAVNVSRVPDENFLADPGTGVGLDDEDDDDEDEGDDEDDEGEGADYRAVIAEFQGNRPRPN